MKQYQISINQQTAATLDGLEAVLKMPKAKIIQKGLAKLKEQFNWQLAKVSPKREKQSTYKYLDKLAGSIHLKDKGTTNYALDPDDKYLQD